MNQSLAPPLLACLDCCWSWRLDHRPAPSTCSRLDCLGFFHSAAACWFFGQVDRPSEVEVKLKFVKLNLFNPATIMYLLRIFANYFTDANLCNEIVQFELMQSGISLHRISLLMQHHMKWIQMRYKQWMLVILLLSSASHHDNIGEVPVAGSLQHLISIWDQVVWSLIWHVKCTTTAQHHSTL